MKRHLSQCQRRSITLLLAALACTDVEATQTFIGLYRVGEGFLLRNTNTSGPPDRVVAIGGPGDIPLIGNWDASKVGLYRPSSSTFFTAGLAPTQFGGLGDLPVVGDWTGHGATTIGLYRPSTNVFYLRNSNTWGPPDMVIPFGAPGDVPVVGDWDGNGTTTIGVYRPTTNTFYLRNSNSWGPPDLIVPFGAPGDIPIAGNWDGVDRTTVGVYRPTSNLFYLSNDNVSVAAVIPFGATCDIPAVGSWSQSELPRSKLRWPFICGSVWNMPIGSDATYVPAGIGLATQAGMTVDEDIIIQRPIAPLKQVILNTAGWDQSKTRCGSLTAQTVYQDGVPIPNNFTTDPGYLGVTPNMSAAILMPDSQTIRQTQPFHVCGNGGTVTSQYAAENENIADGTGIGGAHGGSGMSSIGGTLRMGELVPGSVIRHALKINLSERYYYYNAGDATPGYRWPAHHADADPNACAGYAGHVSAMRMGALLALRPEFSIAALRTQPAKILATALADFGAYVVDRTCWDVYAVSTEWGPDGRVLDEFASTWGFSFQTSITANCSDTSLACKWAQDMRDIFTSLHVIDDNAPGNIGGAGTRRRPPAPTIAD
jgi:hypothetical protein